MLRPLLISLSAFLGLAAGVRATDSVDLKIQQIGLEGIFVANNAATWVHVQATNTTKEPLEVKLSVAELNLDADAMPASQTFHVPMKMAAGEVRSLDIPLQIVTLAHTVIFAEARDTQGHTVGRTGRAIGDGTQGALIALLCTNAEVCRAIQQSIVLSGTPEEQTRKSQTLRFVQLSDPPSVGWAYNSVATIIVASPLAKLSEAQREAIEIHLHDGGTLVLVEDQLGDGPPLLPPEGKSAAKQSRTASEGSSRRFLAVFRELVPEGKSIAVGNGKFLHFWTAASRVFTDYFRRLGFSASTPAVLREQIERKPGAILNGTVGDERGWLMSRLGTNFTFPTFLELLLWMLAYLVLVGFVNFVVLRRMGRPEWGWVTIPVLSILFSILLYAVSVRNHPKNFGLDEIVEYRMDPRSQLALLTSSVRLSAPVRAKIDLTVPADLVYEYPQRGSIDVGPILPQAREEGISEITLGEKWETELALRRWSFSDLEFHGKRKFAGTIFRDSVGHFHNTSGVHFQKAILVDKDDVFVLDNFESSADVDLGHARRIAYVQEAGRIVPNQKAYPSPPFPYRTTEGGWGASEEQLRGYEKERDALAQQPFSLLELIRGWSPVSDDVFCDTKAVFFGLSTEAPLGAEVHDRSPDHRAYSLTIVTFKEWP